MYRLAECFGQFRRFDPLFVLFIVLFQGSYNLHFTPAMTKGDVIPVISFSDGFFGFNKSNSIATDVQKPGR